MRKCEGNAYFRARADVIRQGVGERARARACANANDFAARGLCAIVVVTRFGRAILRARARACANAKEICTFGRGTRYPTGRV